MMRKAAAFIASMMVCLISAPSQAAEISCSNLYSGEKSYACWEPRRLPTAYVPWLGGFLNGQISKGDYDKVVMFIRANHPFVRHFNLVSPGGNVDEALKIGRLFRKYLIATVAPSNERV